jgi:hypothetical protein
MGENLCMFIEHKYHDAPVPANVDGNIGGGLEMFVCSWADPVRSGGWPEGPY